VISSERLPLVVLDVVDQVLEVPRITRHPVEVVSDHPVNQPRGHVLEQTPELRPEGALDQRLDALDDFVAGVDVNARVAVGQ
jgi:hypothetical protein